MKLLLRYSLQLLKVSGWLVKEFEQLVETANAWAKKEHNGDGTHKFVSVQSLTWLGETQTTVGAAGGASAQPATPLGYLLVTLSDGTEVAVPYHQAS